MTGDSHIKSTSGTIHLQLPEEDAGELNISGKAPVINVDNVDNISVTNVDNHSSCSSNTSQEHVPHLNLQTSSGTINIKKQDWLASLNLKLS